MYALKLSAINEYETSVEDIDTMNDNEKVSKNTLNRHENEGKRSLLSVFSFPVGKEYLDHAVPSTVSSPESATLSGKEQNRYSTYTESDDDRDFLEDFDEFDNGETNDWLHSSEQKNNLDMFRENDENDELLELKEELECKLNFARQGNDIDEGTHTQQLFRSINPTLEALRLSSPSKSKQNTKKGTEHQVSTSKSHMNLRARIPNRVSVEKRLNHKNSLPIMPRYRKVLVMEENEDEMKEKTEDEERGADQKTLGMCKNLLGVECSFKDNIHDAYFKSISKRNITQGQQHDNVYTPYLNNSDHDPLNLSSTHYTIVRDDALLAPQLHKSTRKNKNLDEFREADNRKHKYQYEKGSTAYRIKTIKQEIDHNAPMKSGKMSYNPKLKKWEGNDEVLHRFKTVDEMDNYKALLITKKDDSNIYSSHKNNSNNSMGKMTGKVVGKMMFDERNLRWFNMEGREIDPFVGFNGTIKAKPLPHGVSKSVSFLRTKSQPQNNSNNTCSSVNRYHSLNTNSSLNPIFIIPGKKLDEFYHEEKRWYRKIGAWFSGDLTTDTTNTSYMYEIRNMVMNSARS